MHGSRQLEITRQRAGEPAATPVGVPKLDRKALERLMRHVLRPALGEGRLRFGDSDGKVTLAFESPWPDGTTHLRFTPLELVEKLAALVPRPHENLLVYHGVFAGNAADRHACVSYGREAPVSPRRRPPKPTDVSESAADQDRAMPARMRGDWATLMKRGLGVDVLVCPRCGARMRVLAVLADGRAASRVADHLGLNRTRGGPTSDAVGRGAPPDSGAYHVDYDETPPPDYDV